MDINVFLFNSFIVKAKTAQKKIIRTADFGLVAGRRYFIEFLSRRSL